MVCIYFEKAFDYLLAVCDYTFCCHCYGDLKPGYHPSQSTKIYYTMKSYFALLITLLIVGACSIKQDAGYADAVFINGHIWTGDSTSFEEAIAVSRNTILRVGSTEDKEGHRRQNKGC
jgi:hypothetical protein